MMPSKQDKAVLLCTSHSQYVLCSLLFCQRSMGGLSVPLCAFQGTVSLQAPTGKTLSLSTYEVSSDGLKISPTNAKKVTAGLSVSQLGAWGLPFAVLTMQMDKVEKKQHHKKHFNNILYPSTAITFT